jgi:hypothetical protein
MQLSEIQKLKKFIKKIKEISGTDGAPGYLTPNAFAPSHDEDDAGKKALEADDTYTVKPSKEKKNFVKLKEVSYKTFKEDQSRSDVQKVNSAILEINKKIREINSILDHTTKLKNESKINDSKLWKKTNEALIKISKRMNEAAKKTKKFANLKEIQANQVKDKMVKMLASAGMNIPASDVEVAQDGSDYNIDVYINGEPYGFDLVGDILSYQDYDKEVELGLFSKEQDIIEKIRKILQ